MMALQKKIFTKRFSNGFTLEVTKIGFVFWNNELQHRWIIDASTVIEDNTFRTGKYTANIKNKCGSFLEFNTIKGVTK